MQDGARDWGLGARCWVSGGASEIAPTHPNAPLVRRRQDSGFREARQLTNLLLKIKCYGRQMATLELDEEKDGTVACHDVLETKGVSFL